MARPDSSVNLEDKLAKVVDHWSPKTVVEVNGLELKAVRVLGEFVWHDHPEGDELFLIIRGELRIDLADRDSVSLRAGEVFVVPRGVQHRPVAEQECELYILDPAGTVNTGDAGGELTAGDEWI
jgi:mannose-6-phosphate isomerase-like protein (cupin superfamily)